MNTRYTLIVALLAIAAAAFAYTQREAEPVNYTDGGPTATPAAFVELDPAKLQEVEAQTADGKVKLVRVAGGWEVDGKGKASETAGSTLERLAKPELLRDLGTELKPEDYGFATASMTVTLKLAEGEPTVLQVGDKNPIDPQYYLRLKDDKRIVLVSSTDWDSLKDWIANPPLEPTATAAAGTEEAAGTPDPLAPEGLSTPEPDDGGDDDGGDPQTPSPDASAPAIIITLEPPPTGGPTVSSP